MDPAVATVAGRAADAGRAGRCGDRGRAARDAIADGHRGRPGDPGRRDRAEPELVRPGGDRPVRPEPADRPAVHRPGAAPAAAVPDLHQQRADHVRRRPWRGRCGAHPRCPAGRRVEALLRLGDGCRRGGHADPGGSGSRLAPPAAVQHAQAAGRRARGGRGHQRGRHHGHHLHRSQPAAPGTLPQRPGRHRDPATADPSDRPSAAADSGRGHRGLHRGRRGPRPGARRIRYRPGLRAQLRFLCGGPVRHQRLAGPQPRLRRRHHQPRAARAAAARRAPTSAAACGGRTGQERVGRHRQRRRRRPELGDDGALLRDHAALQRPRHGSLLPAATRLVQQGLP